MSAELTKIVLVGSLGKAVGVSEWHLDVKSPAEAIRAININTRGKLEDYLAGPARDRLYRIALQRRDNVLGDGEATHRSGRATIYIMPTISGRGSGGGKIFAGVALLALAYFTGGLAAGAAGWAGAGATATAGASLSLAGSIVVGFGVSLILGGISQVLTPKPQGASQSQPQAESTGFPGTAGAVVQGGPIPLVYGRALVSPVPVAITTTNNDVSTTAAGTLGSVTITNLPGGGQQIDPPPNLVAD